ncbi:WD40 repeat-like protein [Xylariaceae sp. FL0255]|nr:WD40 repeat-like protein [Xylariaceae sp. FL0255]
MEAFPTNQEPDEGYSEHPLNTGLQSLRSAAEMPAWLSSQMHKLSINDKKHLAMLLLNELPTTAVADIVLNHLNPRLYINFVNHLPPEICLKILGYLDATALIHVALCCRGWYDLAGDYKLWEKLYYREGWRAITSEIEAAEKRMNENSTASQMHPRKLRSMEDGHASKKRAIYDPTQEEDDYEMVDADAPFAHESNDTNMSGASLFGGPGTAGESGSSFRSNTSVVQHMNDLVMKSPSPMPDSQGLPFSRSNKGKGKAVPESSVATTSSNETSVGSNLPKSTLWIYDSRSRRYKISWQYLYSLRRRLESNWERGRYTNFQLPHPDHPEEGHNECIYSLQYNSEYLVSGSRDCTLRIWNLRTRRLVRPPLLGHQKSVLCLQFDADPEEDLIVSGSSDSDVILWRFSTGEIIQRLRKAHGESVLNVKFDKRILVTCSKDKTIKIFNRQPLRPGDLGYSEYRAVKPVPITLRNYGYDDSPLNQMSIIPPYTMIACLEGHSAAVNAVQICDREIVSASGDRTIKLWDWPKQVIKRIFLGHGKGIACVQYDGRRIVSGSSDNEVKVFDCSSSLEVASLHAHSNLVRTVQAGFGDLPYSREEDQREARAIDQAYLKALSAGQLDERQPGRRRPNNTGSRRPEDITAYGAKLPPGGGGGPYGRIVSGSYDQSIIIWRRDREGSWRSAHILRQEEAAVAAHRQNSSAKLALLRRASPRPAGEEAGDRSDDHPTQSASAPPSLQRPPPTDHSIPTASTMQQIPAPYALMIDDVVPHGPAALHGALRGRPALLVYNSYIQAAIDREPNGITRGQLRQVVSNAMVRAHATNRVRDTTQQGQATTSSTQVEASASASVSVQAPHSGSHIAPPRPSQALRLAQLLNSDDQESEQQPMVLTGGGPPNAGLQRQHEPPTQSQTQPLPASAAAANQTMNQAAQQLQAQTQAQQGQGLPDPQLHPHLAMQDTNPARIFKLQFDARQIICCSQVSTIIGWDFCNGDPELEEVARFFGTID